MKIRPLFFAASVALSVSAFAAGPTSEFTSNDPKKFKLQTTGEGSGFSLCPGFGGYQVVYRVGDERSWLDLKFGGKTIALAEDTFSQCKGARPWKSNTVVQWRGVRKGGQFIPHGMIFRMSSENPNGSQKPYETLVVVRLDGLNSRVVGHATVDTEAEAIADREGLTAKSQAAPSVDAPVQEAPSSGTGQLTAVTTEDGTTITFPNGQRFKLGPGKGLLGPSDNPTAGKPFEVEGDWLVALNEIPATKTSIVHLYLKGKDGRWAELPNVQQRLLKLAGNGRARLNTGFVRVESAQIGWPNTALLYLQYFLADDREPREIRVAVSRTGNLTSGYRGE